MIDRILIAGVGSMAKRHLRLARELFPEAEIKVLSHRPVSVTSEFSDGYLLDIKEALLFDPQIAVIANPAPYHLEIAQELIEGGAHLLIEKPLSISVDGIDKLLQTSKNLNKVLAVGYNLRFDPSLQEMHKMLNDGLIGAALSVRSEVGQYLPTWRPGTDYRNGVSAKQELGGGVLLELSHELDYLRWIFGEFAWVNATLSQQSALEIDVEDSAHLTLGFLPSRNNRQIIATLNLDFIRHDTTRICTVIGESGSLRWDGVLGKVSFFKEGSSQWVTLYEKPVHQDYTYKAEWNNFIQSVYGAESLTVSAMDGLKVVELVMAAHRSSKSGSLVTISGSNPMDGS